MSMHSSTIFQSPHLSVAIPLCVKVYHKQEIYFLLYLLVQIVTWQYNPDVLELTM